MTISASQGKARQIRIRNNDRQILRKALNQKIKDEFKAEERRKLRERVREKIIEELDRDRQKDCSKSKVSDRHRILTVLCIMYYFFLSSHDWFTSRDNLCSLLCLPYYANLFTLTQ